VGFCSSFLSLWRRKALQDKAVVWLTVSHVLHTSQLSYHPELGHLPTMLEVIRCAMPDGCEVNMQHDNVQGLPMDLNILRG
jgi:hypothetical protein